MNSIRIIQEAYINIIIYIEIFLTVHVLVIPPPYPSSSFLASQEVDWYTICLTTKLVLQIWSMVMGTKCSPAHNDARPINSVMNIQQYSVMHMHTYNNHSLSHTHTHTHTCAHTRTHIHIQTNTHNYILNIYEHINLYIHYYIQYTHIIILYRFYDITLYSAYST